MCSLSAIFYLLLKIGFQGIFFKVTELSNTKNLTQSCSARLSSRQTRLGSWCSLYSLLARLKSNSKIWLVPITGYNPYCSSTNKGKRNGEYATKKQPLALNQQRLHFLWSLLQSINRRLYWSLILPAVWPWHSMDLTHLFFLL